MDAPSEAERQRLFDLLQHEFVESQYLLDEYEALTQASNQQVIVLDAKASQSTYTASAKLEGGGVMVLNPNIKPEIVTMGLNGPQIGRLTVGGILAHEGSHMMNNDQGKLGTDAHLEELRAVGINTAPFFSENAYYRSMEMPIRTCYSNCVKDAAIIRRHQ